MKVWYEVEPIRGECHVPAMVYFSLEDAKTEIEKAVGNNIPARIVKVTETREVVE